jgi:hypothetical protein
MGCNRLVQVWISRTDSVLGYSNRSAVQTLLPTATVRADASLRLRKTAPLLESSNHRCAPPRRIARVDLEVFQRYAEKFGGFLFCGRLVRTLLARTGVGGKRGINRKYHRQRWEISECEPGRESVGSDGDLRTGRRRFW